ncbi:MAG: hypothetical protein N2578_09300, partial [Bdellovibrionaceae bacterium]|nr:hypothetical protein [Pseudobdellovibrionaceae bacterium]
GARKVMNYTLILNEAKADAKTRAAEGWTEGPAALVLSVAKVGTLWGSNPISPQFMVFFPHDETTRKNFEVALLRADAIINWTQSPQWSTSLYLSPRFNVQPTKVNQLRSFISASQEYSLSDNVGAYVGLTSDIRFNNLGEGMTAFSDFMSPEIGMNISFGRLLLNPNISEEINTREAMTLGDPNKNDVTYALNVVYSI